MQRYKLRKNLKSNYQMKHESTFVALITNSIYGDPKLFDLKKQVFHSAAKDLKWRGPLNKDKKTTVVDE